MGDGWVGPQRPASRHDRCIQTQAQIGVGNNELDARGFSAGDGADGLTAWFSGDKLTPLSPKRGGSTPLPPFSLAAASSASRSTSSKRSETGELGFCRRLLRRSRIGSNGAGLRRRRTCIVVCDWLDPIGQVDVVLSRVGSPPSPPEEFRYKNTELFRVAKGERRLTF